MRDKHILNGERNVISKDNCDDSLKIKTSACIGQVFDHSSQISVFSKDTFLGDMTNAMLSNKAKLIYISTCSSVLQKIDLYGVIKKEFQQTIVQIGHSKCGT
jgi:hypothetical protein